MKPRKTMLGMTSLLTLSAAIVLLAPQAGHAQYRSTTDPRMIVIPIRSAQDISSDLEHATATRQLVIARNEQAVERLNEIANAIETRESSIDGINDRKDRAKDTGRESEETSLKIEEKANKQAIDLLKRLKSLREAEVDVAKAEEDHADMAILVLQREGDLQVKRSEYDWPSTSMGELARNTASQVLGELEVDLLKLQEDLAGATQKVASKEKKVVEQRIKLHEAQGKLGL